MTAQRESLEILDRICELLPLTKDTGRQPGARGHPQRVSIRHGFRAGFPSLCFALATGVGKTRLMGAFIAYLNQAGASGTSSCWRRT